MWAVFRKEVGWVSAAQTVLYDWLFGKLRVALIGHGPSRLIFFFLKNGLGYQREDFVDKLAK